MNGTAQIIFKKVSHLFVVITVIGMTLGMTTAKIDGAATLTVTKTADTNDGVCDADCSLREAIRAANAQAGDNTIILPSGTYTLTIAGANEDAAATGDLDITDNLVISSTGLTSPTIDGNGIDRVFHIIGVNTAVNISTVTIQNGNPGSSASGGGIYDTGVLTLTNTTVRSNIGDSGAGIYNSDGTLTLVTSTVNANTSNGFFASGSGISSSGTLLLIDSVISGNTSAGSFSSESGGIDNSGTLILDHSIVMSNTSITAGGILNSGTAMLVYSTISGNKGGGIRTAGTMSLVGSLVTSNSGSDGGISNSGTLTLTASTVSSNTTSSFAGGITNGGIAVLMNSSIISNTGTTSGGGLFNYYTGSMTVTNSTVSGNTAQRGGGIYLWSPVFGITGTVSLKDVTLVNNIGGGISNIYSSTIDSRNTIVAGNAGYDCAGPLTSQGYNLIQDATNCTIDGDVTGNVTGQNANVGPLQDNGGPTLTHALLPGSPAIDNGNPATPGTSGTACEPTDQRGVARPQNERCDIGAYEAILSRVFLPIITKQQSGSTIR